MLKPQAILPMSSRLRKREVSPVEVTKECLQRVEQLNPMLNAFVTVTAEAAMAQAQQAETEIMRGEWRGPLHGVPVALKDIIDTAGVRTTAASAAFADRVPEEDAEVVRRLREAGAIILGKNNLHEFAYGGSSMISLFGPMHNPHRPECITGGSSGGSAASVAAGLCFAAIGTDTAGSIREPAALCGCVGLKPTYGRVSTRGILPLSWSLDHAGPLTSTVADSAVVLQSIAGYDARDLTSADVEVMHYMAGLKHSANKLCVGVPRHHFFEDLQAEVASAMDSALQVIEKLAGKFTEITIEVPTDRTLQMAESYAYHAKRVEEIPEKYAPETLRRIRSGEGISAADYIHHRRELETSRRSIKEVFADVDLLITPTTPMTAPAIAELTTNPDALRPAEIKLLRNTRPFNVWGLPAISIPCGFDKKGLPIGLQIAGPHWREDLVLLLAHAYEQASPS